jgi:hypothetical protein
MSLVYHGSILLYSALENMTRSYTPSLTSKISSATPRGLHDAQLHLLLCSGPRRGKNPCRCLHRTSTVSTLQPIYHAGPSWLNDASPRCQV